MSSCACMPQACQHGRLHWHALYPHSFCRMLHVSRCSFVCSCSGRPKGSLDKTKRKPGSGRPLGSKDKKPRKQRQMDSVGGQQQAVALHGSAQSAQARVTPQQLLVELAQHAQHALPPMDHSHVSMLHMQHLQHAHEMQQYNMLSLPVPHHALHPHMHVGHIHSHGYQPPQMQIRAQPPHMRIGIHELSLPPIVHSPPPRFPGSLSSLSHELSPESAHL